MPASLENGFVASVVAGNDDDDDGMERFNVVYGVLYFSYSSLVCVRLQS